jgi:hypothetical protein
MFNKTIRIANGKLKPVWPEFLKLPNRSKNQPKLFCKRFVYIEGQALNKYLGLDKVSNTVKFGTYFFPNGEISPNLAADSSPN